MAQYLFSYGTLQAELAPAEIAPVVRQLRPIGRASIPGILYDLGDYPGAVVGGTNLEVWGQVSNCRKIPKYWASWTNMRNSILPRLSAVNLCASKARPLSTMDE